jgi:hypothetical protein
MEHQLDKASFTTAGVLFGIWGGGLAVTQALPQLFWLGITVCMGSASFTVWRYWPLIVAGFNDKGAQTSTLPMWEKISIPVLVAVEFVGCAYLAIPPVARFATAVWAYVGIPLLSSITSIIQSRIVQGGALLVAGFVLRPLLVRAWPYIKAGRPIGVKFRKYRVVLGMLLWGTLGFSCGHETSTLTIDVCKQLQAYEKDKSELSGVLRKHRIALPAPTTFKKDWGALEQWRTECRWLTLNQRF